MFATQGLGPDNVTAATKATIGPSKKVPPDAFNVTTGEEAGVGLAVGVGVVGAIVGTVGCQVIGGGPEDPASDICTGLVVAGAG